MIRFFVVALVSSFVALGSSLAQDKKEDKGEKKEKGCFIHVTRTACKGQKEKAYAKCKGGAKACEEKKRAKSAEECMAAAAAECSNSRFNITSSKVILARFDGKELDAPETPDKANPKNFCDPKRKDFNGCPDGVEMD